MSTDKIIEAISELLLLIEIALDGEEQKHIRKRSINDARKSYNSLQTQIRNEKILKGIEADRPLTMRF